MAMGKMYVAKRRRYAKRTKKPRKARRKRAEGNRRELTGITTLGGRAPFGKSFHYSTKYYSRYQVVNPGLGGLPATYVYGANDVYDPDQTGGGGETMGFNQLMPFYDHFIVKSSRITVTCINTDATYEQVVSLGVRDTNTLSLDERQIIENGGCEYKLLSPAGNTGDRVTLVVDCNPASFLGIPWNDDSLKGTATAGPSENVFFQITAWPLVSVDTSPIHLTALLEYEVALVEPKLGPTS